MTVSNIFRMLESLEVEGGGSTAAAGSTNSSTVGSPEEGGWDATPEKDSTRGCLELAFIWAALCLRKVAPIGAIMCTGSNAGKSFKPKCNKIRWMKTGKKRSCIVCCRTTPMNLNQGSNEKSRKTHRTISHRGIQKCTSLNRNVCASERWAR